MGTDGAGLLRALNRPGGVNPAVAPTKVLSALRTDTLHLLPHPPHVAPGELRPVVLWPARPSDARAWKATAGIRRRCPPAPRRGRWARHPCSWRSGGWAQEPLLFVSGTVGIAVVAASPPSRARTAAIAAGAVLLAGRLVIQVGLAVGNGLKRPPATCDAPTNPYGALGRVFCPRSILPQRM